MNNAEWFLIGCLSAIAIVYFITWALCNATQMDDDEQFDYHSNFSDLEIKDK